MNLLPLEDGKILVQLARHSIDTFFSKKTIFMPEADKFKEKRGVFVTLSELGKLRGCIGYPMPVFPLNRAIIDAARSAAFKDPRFEPVTKDEMGDITMEVSVLTEPELIVVEQPEEYLDKIKIGRDGLIIKSPFGSGLLLPQVFTDHDTTPKQALEMTCQKSGIDDDAWMDSEIQIYRFQAQIFEETEPNGEIIEKKI